MDIVVALNGSKERNLSFAPGDEVTLNLIVYAQDGDTTPITPTNFYWSTGGGSFLPVGSQFSFPCVNRTPYSIAADIAGVRTTLVYGIIEAPFGYRCSWYCGGGIFPPVIPTAQAVNVIVSDVGEYYVARNVEDALQELGETVRSAQPGYLTPTQVTDVRNGSLIVQNGEQTAVAYSAGLSMTSTLQRVSYLNDVYAPLGSVLPFTTGAIFDSPKFRRVRGIDGSLLASVAGARNIGVQQDDVTAIPRDLEWESRQRVLVGQFGYLDSDGMYDAATVQRAIDFCLKFPRPPTLVINGPCRLDASIIINRPVDTTMGKFRIIGQGEGAGFYISNGITMFDSTLEMGVDPVSEFIRFESLIMEATDANLVAFVVSGKFLRMEWVNCEFRKIRCVTTASYIQDFLFDTCRYNSVPGEFIHCDGLYNVLVRGGAWKFGFTMIGCVSTGRGANGLHFSCGFLAEGAGSNLVRANGATISVIGCHFEKNAAGEINLFVGGATNNSVTVLGNYIYNPDHTDGFVYYGPTDKVHSGGNTCFPNALHKQISNVVAFTSTSDSAAVLTNQPDQIVSSVAGVLSNVAEGKVGNLSVNERLGVGSGPIAGIKAFIQGEGLTADTRALVVANGNGLDSLTIYDDRGARFHGNVGIGNSPIGGIKSFIQGDGTSNSTRSMVVSNGAGLDSMTVYDDRSVRLHAAFGANGKDPVGLQASGGTLAGVIAALVACGILSS